MIEQRFDVAVIGAGPAGATAALMVARKGHTVALIERHKLPRGVPCTGWLNVRAAAILDDMGVRYQPLRDAAFTDVTFYSADCTKIARPKFDGPVGYLIDRAAFDHALASAAVDAGATLLQGAPATDVRLQESHVEVSLGDGRQVVSRLLVVASGRASPLVARLGLSVRPPETPIWSIPVEAALKSSARREPPRVSVVLGLDGGSSFGFCCVTPARVYATVNWFGASAGASPALVRLCRLAAEKGIVPVDLSSVAATAKPILCPAAAALDIDTHVAKHTLLIGDAGGFVSAVSNEGVYPAMWSARIAAGVIDEALRSSYSQDELKNFDSRWRMEIADHLRSSHTDLRFLLPLVFTNQPMADRMGAAFFFGENL